MSEGEEAASVLAVAEPAAEVASEPAKPKRTRRKKPAEATEADAVEANGQPEPEETPVSAPQADNDANGTADTGGETGEPRRGWWQRTFGQ